ncbi:hypothetical protein SAMN02745751_00217 [Dethiosulfatibacter aminovorans DSM 17477]|uniref:Uncharacterized protein n=1 Tax=Dethiosulfatibacter aminovorans DSM 17477 TaxID=1121476 RepID=A0A1M6AR33_9FIRM|nr:DUF2202 domain-containing protein [Dethiosulfatibacter aminovorans]SHI38926.1 hypothetical protein SAMN02745751_00217 [Dethiosulfatibacter aminovorans DSM 17477]
MKKLMITLLAIVMVLGTMVSAFADGGADEVVAGESYTLEEMLEYAYQDESKALAEYDAIMEKFGVEAPFANIKRAEENHLNAVIRLYDYFGLEVPEFEFEVPALPKSLEETYSIGVQAEIDNIAMYETFLENEDIDPVVARVFTQLMKGSENHKAAFERAGECDGDCTFESMNGMGRKGAGQSAGERFGNRSYGRENGLQTGNRENKRLQMMDPENCPNIQ